MVLLATLALAAEPGFALVQVTGADDDCCAQNVAVALAKLPFVKGAAADWKTGQACLALSGPADLAAMQTALAPGGYGATKVDLVEACPEGLTPKRADPWAAATGLDVQIVSRGEAVDLGPTLAKGKFTVVDFGAPWCGPCYPAAEKLQAYLKAHADTAVRAVVLEGADAKASFALPVVKQHLQFAEGLPWMVVHAPNGKKLYEGNDVDAALAAIDKKRK